MGLYFSAGGRVRKRKQVGFVHRADCITPLLNWLTEAPKLEQHFDKVSHATWAANEDLNFNYWLIFLEKAVIETYEET